MLLKRVVLLTAAAIFFLTFSVYADSPFLSAIHGEVLQVYAEQSKLLIKSDQGKRVIELGDDCQIFRRGQKVTIESLRPVAFDSFQEVLCLLDSRGLANHVFVHYCVQEHNGILVSYDIFGYVKNGAQ